jgi:alpha-L-fucosidase
MPIEASQHDPPQGAQRLSLGALRAWESLGYGMFIHFGMSTFDGDENSKGDKPSTLYSPDQLNVDQWCQVARDAGMKYAILTAKHVAGHCLWPSKQTDYHVGTSGNKTDVVERFVKACGQHSLMAGFYYCSWDNHHTLGSITPTYTRWDDAFTTQAYREFQFRQIEELLTQYGPWGEVWIDIPGVLGAGGRRDQYQQIARLAPQPLIMMNSGYNDGIKLKYDYAWPTDLLAIERNLPHSERGYRRWLKIAETNDPPRDYYIPGEVCDTIGYHWFRVEGDPPRSDAELLAMRLLCRERQVNLLLDVPPDKHGLIPQEHIDALMRLRKNMDRFAA